MAPPGKKLPKIGLDTADNKALIQTYFGSFNTQDEGETTVITGM